MEDYMTTATARALNNQDRCDRCQAQAYVRFELEKGLELLFCNHHAVQHGEKLKAIAVNVTDETHRLTEIAKA
jgi:hypothetical protein